MRVPTHAETFEVLCLQIADEGRKDVLFGEDVVRARDVVSPFLVGNEFPGLYFEFPLLGEPFMDVTVLYDTLEPETRIESELAPHTDELIDWYAGVRQRFLDISMGFELDTSNPSLSAAAIHFQPRAHEELAMPFCERLGEPERGQLYVDLASRMPEGWQLSFFGLFRGRPHAPMRVCGYLGQDERKACVQDPSRLAGVFEQIGFSAYDDALLAQATELIATPSACMDFQFDVYPTGELGPAFALDVMFKYRKPADARASFATGSNARVMSLYERWGVADERWKLVPDGLFARSLPVLKDDGSRGVYAFTVLPGWAKTRWIDGCIQPAKYYFNGGGGLMHR